MTSDNRTRWWIDYFRDLAHQKDESPRYGFSNEAVMVQNVGAIVEASGRVRGMRVLDCGCGSGRLARVFHGLGASVTAFDAVAEHFQSQATECPNVRWVHATVDGFLNETHVTGDSWDIVVASEIAQHVGFDTVLQLASLVAPGGRLVATFPNADCPIVSDAARRFDGHYVPVSLSALPDLLATAGIRQRSHWRGLRFQDDQRVAPYIATGWNPTLAREQSSGINRILLVVLDDRLEVEDGATD